MNSNLNDQQTMQPTDEKIATRQQKLAYSRPVLQVYGSVVKLTQGNAGVSFDGNSGTVGKK